MESDFNPFTISEPSKTEEDKKEDWDDSPTFGRSPWPDEELI